ncbi:MAG: glycosyl transferase [Gemmatimonadota bacterium]|nr:glycosyl transferase [Gemmatimonadota bacterium]
MESDRAEFIGRGRSLATPRAMMPHETLSGSTGNVLDPVLAIRRTVMIPPGQSETMLWLIGAGADRAEAESAVAEIANGGTAASQKVFDAAATRASGLAVPAGGSARWHRALGAAVYGSAERAPRSRGKGVVDTDVGIFDEASALIAPGGDGSLDVTSSPPPQFVQADVADAPAHFPRESGELRFFNGYGGFSRDGTEYVIRPERTDRGLRLPPQPWVNVIANERIGFIASERGAGCTWCVNSRLNRLTPWSNDPVIDPQNEALYVRDEESGKAWSPTPGPLAGAGSYEIRHGFGYTTYVHETATLVEETTVFVPREDAVKLTRVRIKNTGVAPRQLTVFSYSQLVLGGVAWETAPHVRPKVGDDGVIRITSSDAGVFTSLVAFAAAVPSDEGSTVSAGTDRRAFLGPYGSAEAPAALRSDLPRDEARGVSGDHCAAFQVRLTIAPGSSAECTFMLGECTSSSVADEILDRYRRPAAVDAALEGAREFWCELVSGVQISTPSPAIDLMVNGWLAYQNLSCRIWGRSAFYQSGGAYGFRDQLQDAAALIHLAPERTREQLLLHAAHQFVEGDVLHWWHPPASEGIRTHFSDDLLWLPYVVAYYVGVTGDWAVLDEVVPFVTGPELEPDEDEIFMRPNTGVSPASLYDHCCLALDRSLTRGAHGLPLMGTGDWNDGMNRVGREGRGESVWLGFFLSRILEDFTPICERRGDAARAAGYTEYSAALDAALNDAGWDGAWYRRAYYDDGTPLGTASGDECRIDAIAQSWAVISRVAAVDRATQAMDAMEANLVAEDDGIIRLLTPPFDRTTHDPGYIKGYLPGVRENGGQYTHAALWAVKALAEMGRHERAARLLEMLSPVTRGGTSDKVEVYQAEPYVVAADVYGVAPHVGRGGWTWYTGSAGWMYRVALESVLGIEMRGGQTMIVRPCIPDAWPGFSVRYKLPDRVTEYEIVVTRTGADGATTATLDGDASLVSVENGAVQFDIVRDGCNHVVTVVLGADSGPTYTQRNLTAGARRRES